MKTLISLLLVASALACHGQLYETGTNLVVRGNQTNAGNIQGATFTGNGAAITGISAANVSAGTLPAAQMPALTGAITTSAGAVATSLGSFTSASLIAALTDESGSGLAIFQTSPSIITPTIVSFANATHNHQNAAGGGALTLSSAAFANQGTTVQVLYGNASGNPSWASPPGYTIILSSSANQSPAQNATYFFGVCPLTTLNTTYGICSAYVPRAGTIKTVWYWVQVTGTAGTTGQAPAHSIRVNNTTDCGSSTFEWNQTVTNVAVTGVSQAVAAGDTIAWKIATPVTWTTTPTTCRIYCMVYIE